MEKINIGIREAKAKLSKLIQDVQKGREIIITDRGIPVAYLGPIKKDKLSLKQRLSELEKAGIIEPQKKSKKLPPPLNLPDQKAQAILQEDRNR